MVSSTPEYLKGRDWENTEEVWMDYAVGYHVLFFIIFCILFFFKKKKKPQEKPKTP